MREQSASEVEARDRRRVAGRGARGRSHPVFDSFFHIKSLEVPYPGRLGERGLMGEFYGIHEDNDPTKRLMVVIYRLTH